MIIYMSSYRLKYDQIVTIEQRIAEIEDLIDLCGTYDEYILNNLYTELDELENKVEKSLKFF